jgi:hypothetical protein
VSRLGHVLVIAGLCAVGAALALNASAWPGTVVATVGAVLVAIEGLAEWAARAESAVHATAAADRLDALAQATARLESKVEALERRDALGRM